MKKHTKLKRGKKNVWLRKINFNNISLIETFYSDILVKELDYHQLQRRGTFILTPALFRLLLHTQSNLQINFLLWQLH